MAETINTGSTPYDDVFRTLVVDHKELVIALINEMFPDIEKYSGDEDIVSLSEYYEVNRQDGEQDRIITDSAIIVTDHYGNRKTFHLECQSTNDGSVIIRMFEYDMQIALKTAGSYTPGELKVEMPKSGILFLRCTDNTPDEMLVRMTLPDGTEVSYLMPVLKLKKYDIKTIFDKELYFLIPFYLFNLEKIFQAVESKDEKEDERFREEITRLKERLETAYKHGGIDAYTYRSIVDLFKKVGAALTKGRDHVLAETEAIMGGQVLEYEAKTILKKGIAQGLSQGISQGISQGEISGGNKMLYELVSDGTITKEKAAEKAGITVDDFVKNMIACGYKI